MAHLVASITLNSARSYVMQSSFLTQRMVSSIPIVFIWDNSISLEGFLSSVLLWLVIIVAVVGVGVTVVVVIIIAIVVVVESSSVVKLSFLHFLATGASLSPVFLLVLSAFAIVALVIQHPEASQEKLDVTSQIASLKFSKLSMRTLGDQLPDCQNLLV
ncbi:hypothetical protein Tco_1172997 [Tanacetum coccineum]